MHFELLIFIFIDRQLCGYRDLLVVAGEDLVRALNILSRSDTGNYRCNYQTEKHCEHTGIYRRFEIFKHGIVKFDAAEIADE